MVAIKITQSIKNKNKKYNIGFVENNAVGAIVKVSLPNKFHKTEPVSGGYKTRTDLHELDGFMPFIRTAFDPFTQKENTNNIVKGFDENEVFTHYTYKIKELTQEQIDAYLLQFEDNEDDTEEEAHESEGVALIRKTRKRIRRRLKKEVLTVNQANKLRRWFSQLFYQLRQGDWDLAYEDITAESFPTSANQDLINDIDWLKEKLNTYINENFNE